MKSSEKRTLFFGGVAAALFLGAVSFLFIKTLPNSFPVSTPEIVILEISYSTETPSIGPEDAQPEQGIHKGIQVGSYVQVKGTDGEGLRFRAAASTTAEILTIAMESEAFLVQQGPVESDGYVWFYLTAPYDDTRSGWAASEFLVLLNAKEP